MYRGGVVLVSGDPPACLPMLVEALRTAAAPRAVIEISCGPALDFSELYAGAVLPPPIYVFDDADRLSDVQIRDARRRQIRGGRELWGVEEEDASAIPSELLIAIVGPKMEERYRILVRK